MYRSVCLYVYMCVYVPVCVVCVCVFTSQGICVEVRGLPGVSFLFSHDKFKS